MTNKEAAEKLKETYSDIFPMGYDEPEELLLAIQALERQEQYEELTFVLRSEIDYCEDFKGTKELYIDRAMEVYKGCLKLLDYKEYCPKCGKAVESAYNFCPGCGQKIDWEVQNGV